MAIPAHVQPFWSAFELHTGGAAGSRFYEAFSFGDSAALADELGQLVLAGKKRATASAAWSYQASGRPPPQPGDLSVVTDSQQQPLCIIETLSLEVLPFDQVDAEFAQAEGEGDGSLAFWQAAHRAYFGRECERAGRVFSTDMPVACERFRVVYPAEVADDAA